MFRSISFHLHFNKLVQKSRLDVLYRVNRRFTRGSYRFLHCPRGQFPQNFAVISRVSRAKRPEPLRTCMHGRRTPSCRVFCRSAVFQKFMYTFGKSCGILYQMVRRAKRRGTSFSCFFQAAAGGPVLKIFRTAVPNRLPQRAAAEERYAKSDPI